MDVVWLFLFVCIGGVVRLCMLMLDEIGIVACFYPWDCGYWELWAAC